MYRHPLASLAALAALTCGALIVCAPQRLAAQNFDSREYVFEDQGVEPFDLDEWLGGQQTVVPCQDCYQHDCHQCEPDFRESWFWQLLPEGLIYRSYLAGPHEPRFSIVGYQLDRSGWTWESTLGARVGLIRYGTPYRSFIQGIQLDAEGAAFVRLDSSREMVSNDFRFGFPLTVGFGWYQTKLAYYHVSSHLGDDFLLRTGRLPVDYVRDVIVWGHSFYLSDALRVYFDIGYAFNTSGGAEPWEFQFGFEYSSICRTGPRGAPFVAVDAHLREEVNFGGNLVAEAGWQWRGKPGGPLLRLGFYYHNGQGTQYQFFNRFERQTGVGLWYDF